MLLGDALGDLALGEQPGTITFGPLVPVFSDPALNPTRRINDPQPYQQVGLPITPWDRQLPAGFEPFIRPTVRTNDPQPEIIVGLPITPWDRLAPNYSEWVKPKPGLAPELTAYPVVNQPITPWDRIWPSFVDIGFQPKRDFDRATLPITLKPTTFVENIDTALRPSPRTLDHQALPIQTTAPVITFVAPVNLDQSWKPKARTNDPQTYQQVGLPIKPAALTPITIEQALRPAIRINDPQPYLFVGLPIKPAAISPDTIEHPGLKGRIDVWVPYAVPFAIAKTPSTLAPDPVDQYQRYRTRTYDITEAVLAFKSTITPANLTPINLEAGFNRKAIDTTSSFPIIAKSQSFALSGGFDGAPTKKLIEGSALPFAPPSARASLSQDLLLDPRRPREVIAYQAVIYPTITYFSVFPQYDAYRAKLILGEVSILTTLTSPVSNTVVYPDYCFVDIRRQGAQDGILSIGSVILPPPIVAKSIDHFIIRSRRRMRR